MHFESSSYTSNRIQWRQLMNFPSVLTYGGALLAVFFGLTPAGYGQTPCKSIDDVRLARLASVRQASPEALADLQELSLHPPRGKIVGGQPTLIADNPWQIAMIRS